MKKTKSRHAAWTTLKNALQKFCYLFQSQLQCDYSNGGTWNKIIQSQRFLKTKDSHFFFKRTNKIQGSTIKLLKYSKSLELTWPFRKHPKNYERFWFVCKKKPWEFFVFKKRCDCIIFFQVPFWSSRTVVFFFFLHLLTVMAYFSSGNKWNKTKTKKKAFSWCLLRENKK